MNLKVAITGAGPAGLLLAHHLVGRPGYNVHIYEKKEDLALISQQEDRSYPIGLQGRGMSAIREIPNLEAELESFGRWIDSVSVHQGTKKPKKIAKPPMLMIERNDLARGMLQSLRKRSQSSPSSSLTVHWGCGVKNVFLHNQTICTDNDLHETFDYLVAADGANSAVRNSLAADPKADLEYDMKMVPEAYKCLFFQTKSVDGEMELDPTSLHGWMGSTHQILTVPVKDDYSSGVYIFPNDEDSFDSFQTPGEVLTYLDSKAPGSAKFVSVEEAKEILKRPTARSWTVKCNRLVVQDRAVLVGDAAHSLSGGAQGCNSALEDVQILNRLLLAHNEDWKKALPIYNAERLPDAHAVHELSAYGYPKSKLMQIEFVGRIILRKILPDALAQKLRPLPMDIMSDETLSYSEVFEKSHWWTDRVKSKAAKTT